MVEIRCSKCDLNKPEEQFDRSKRNLTGRKYICKACCKIYQHKYYRDNRDRLIPGNRARYSRDQHLAMRLKSNFGISQEKYDEFLSAQDGTCAICTNKCSSGRNLAVDHDHSCCPGKTSCGKCIRGLLCARCNPGLGQFKDDTKLLLKAVEYLERTRSV